MSCITLAFVGHGRVLAISHSNCDKIDCHLSRSHSYAKGQGHIVRSKVTNGLVYILEQACRFVAPLVSSEFVPKITS